MNVEESFVQAFQAITLKRTGGSGFMQLLYL